MSAINYLTLVSTIVVTASGPVPAGHIHIASTNSAPSWSNSISTNGIQGSTIVVSSITTSTITVSSLGYSTISGSTINAQNITLSTLTVSSINSGAPGVAEYSTLNVSSLNATSTITTSTLSVSTMTGSTLTISMLTGLIISASSITSSDLVLSTLTVSSINGLPPGTGGSGGGTTIFSTLGVSSLNANSTITGSTLIATGRVGIGSTTMNGLLSVNAGATNTLALSLTSSGPGWGSGMQLINNTATTGRNYGIYAGSDGALHFPDSTAGTDRVLINYLGNVGIGTNTPGYLLDVNGTLNVRGSFTVNGTAVATGTGSVWTVGASNCIYYSAGNTCLYRNRLVFSNAINDFNHSIFNNSSNWDGEGVIDGFKYNGYACHWFRVGNASGATPTTAMFMNTSAQVCIGATTDAQNNKLRVFGGNATSGISLGDYMTSTGVKYIGVTNLTDGTNVSASSGFSGITFGSPYDGGGTSGYLAFHTHGYGISSDERMRIDKGGKVGIGKTNPSQLLDVAGAINCTSFLVNGTAVATGTGSVWGVSGSTAYYTSGNVGISTTAAITNLHVRVPTYSSPVFIVDAGGQGTDTTPPRGIGKPLIGVGANSWSNVSSGDYYGIGFGYNANNNAASYYPGEIGFLIQNTGGGEFGDLVFSTRPTTTNTTIASERMRITSAGNVGIGTTVAAQTLSVYGTMGISSASGVYNSFFIKSSSTATDYASMYFVNNTPANAYMGLGGSGVGGNFQNNFFVQSPNAIAFNTNGNGSSGTNTMYLTSTGNVGIGTVSPAYKLVVQTASGSAGFVHTDGTIIVGSYVGGSVTAGWYGTTSNHPLCFFTNNSAASLTINTSGNVGIGTVSPGNKLHIYSTTANDGILFQNAFNSSTGSIKLYTTTAAGNFILDGTADAGVVLPTDGKDLFLGRTTNLYTSMVVKGGTGYVGIGTAAPNASLQITNSSAVGSGYGALLVDSPNVGSAGGCVTIRNSAGGANAFCSLMFEIDGTTSCQTGTTPLGFAAGNAMIYCQNVGGGSNAGKLGFILWNGGGEVELFTILPSGNVGIGTATPATILHVARDVSTNDNFSLMTYYENTTPAYHDWAVGPYIDGGSATFAIRSGSNNLPTSLVNMFYINSNGTAIRFPQYTTTGTLSINGAGGTISSSSDRRIKQDIVYQTDTADALARVLQLRPATFRFLEQDATHLGFIAQDVEQCIPLAVDGKKYEWQWVPTENGAPTFDAEGNMIYQLDKDGNRIIRPRGLEDRAILAMQTLAIQQLAAENTQLKSQVTSLSASHASLLAWAQTQGFVQ